MNFMGKKEAFSIIQKVLEKNIDKNEDYFSQYYCYDKRINKISI